jgi:hypothetical protein
MSSHTDPFLAQVTASPLFYEALASAGTIAEGLSIARDAGFDIDEGTLRAAISTRRTGETPTDSELDDSELGWVVGGSSGDSGDW